jgi:hypothetical protein
MFDMQAWKVIVVAVVACASVAWMSSALVRLFSRRAPSAATLRRGTAKGGLEVVLFPYKAGVVLCSRRAGAGGAVRHGYV